MQTEREGLTYGGGAAGGTGQEPGAYTPPDTSSPKIGDNQYRSGDGNTTERAKDMGAEVAGRAKETGAQLADSAKEAGSQLAAGADTGMDRAASGLESAATQVRERAGEGDGMRAAAGTKVADGLEKASTYLRDHESREVWDDLETYIRDHPTQALIGAVAAGFVLARVMR